MQPQQRVQSSSKSTALFSSSSSSSSSSTSAVVAGLRRVAHTVGYCRAPSSTRPSSL
jgi:hypothetical protein